MMIPLKRFLLITALAICPPSLINAQSQDSPASLPKLDSRAALQDALNWSIDAISTHASLGVYGRKDGYFKPGISFFKGFKLDHADGCTLYLKNEGIHESNRKPYLCEVTIPISDLDASSGMLRKSPTGKPDIDKQYGTWRLYLLTKDERATARIYAKDSPLGDFRGSVVLFEFEDKAVAKRFEEGIKQVIKMCQRE